MLGREAGLPLGVQRTLGDSSRSSSSSSSLQGLEVGGSGSSGSSGTASDGFATAGGAEATEGGEAGAAAAALDPLSLRSLKLDRLRLISKKFTQLEEQKKAASLKTKPFAFVSTFKVGSTWEQGGGQAP